MTNTGRAATGAQQPLGYGSSTVDRACGNSSDQSRLKCRPRLSKRCCAQHTMRSANRCSLPLKHDDHRPTASFNPERAPRDDSDDLLASLHKQNRARTEVGWACLGWHSRYPMGCTRGAMNSVGDRASCKCWPPGPSMRLSPSAHLAKVPAGATILWLKCLSSRARNPHVIGGPRQFLGFPGLSV